MRVLVVTCSATGDDARIVHRECRALLDAGHEVTLVSSPPSSTAADPLGLVRVAIPRAVGRRRWQSWRGARRAARTHGAHSDLLVVHDPELIPVLLLRPQRMPVVWDVREDYVASVSDRRYIPDALRPIVRRLVGSIHTLARRRCHLVLAEDAYVGVVGEAPVIPNSTWVPDVPAPPGVGADGRPEVVYVGRISESRGATEMLALGRAVAPWVSVVLVGSTDAAVEPLVRAAADEGAITWTGPLANPDALRRVDGALAGLSLLAPEPNYVHSRPTKVLEYFARGVPCISTPLPLAVETVEAACAGIIVPYGDVEECARAVLELAADPGRRAEWGVRGNAYVREHFNWAVDGARFVSLLERWAAG